MRSWVDNEAIVQRVRDWLSLTADEVGQLPELGESEPALDADELPPVGLLQLLEGFTALRHELKLQTKSARSQEEVLQAALAGLEQAAQQLHSVQARESEAAARAAEPLVVTLIELDEALERGEQAFVRMEQRTVQAAADALARELGRQFATLSRWQRLRARHWQATVQRICGQHLEGLDQRLLAPLREGYELIRARLQRMLQQQQIRRIDCVGRRVDPHQMNVVELVTDADQPPETVLEELRPGYTWQNRVIRCAEVRAAGRRAASGAADTYSGP